MPFQHNVFACFILRLHTFQAELVSVLAHYMLPRNRYSKRKEKGFPAFMYFHVLQFVPRQRTLPPLIEMLVQIFIN